MPPIPGDKRAHRVLDFLIAIESPAISAALAAHGLSAAVIQEGWTLLRDYARSRQPYQPTEVRKPELGPLGAWEDRWWVVADAALAHRYPAVHQRLFRNLGRSQGTQQFLYVGELVARLRALQKLKQAEARAAVALLERRGVTSAVIAEAEGLLKRMTTIREGRPASITPEQKRSAEEALWVWYVEWSKISRAVIDDPRMLRVLGFGQVGRPRGSTKKRATAKAQA